MKLKDKESWELVVSKNQVGYGMGIIRFTETWANLMEREIEKGFLVKDIAEKCSSIADTEGITGFMYGCAVGILSQVWEYGEDLRKWHNKDYGIDEENDNGGVVNPAIISLTKAERNDL